MNAIVTTELAHLLDEAGVEYERLPHRHTETAVAEAVAIGVTPAQVAKTLVVKTSEGFARAVIPASERLDLRRLREIVGATKDTIALASETELAGAYPMFELGAVPPFGGPSGDRVFVDRRIAAQETVLLEAGTHEESFRLKSDELVRLARAEIVDICRD